MREMHNQKEIKINNLPSKDQLAGVLAKENAPKEVHSNVFKAQYHFRGSALQDLSGHSSEPLLYGMFHQEIDVSQIPDFNL